MLPENLPGLFSSDLDVTKGFRSRLLRLVFVLFLAPFRFLRSAEYFQSFPLSHLGSKFVQGDKRFETPHGSVLS
jgi:hypothetical protein